METDRKFKCVICFSSYSSSGTLKRHHQVKHLETNTKVACQDCGRQFNSKDAMVVHINRVHKGISYKCNQCDKEFKNNSSKTKHIRSYHEHVKYKCSLCDYQAAGKSTLMVH